MGGCDVICRASLFVGVFFCVPLLTEMHTEAQSSSDWSFGEIIDDQPSENMREQSPVGGENITTNTPLPTSVDDDNYLAAALACAERDQPARAVKYCTALIELTPQEATFFVARGMAYLELKNLEASELDFEQADELNVMPTEVRYSLGYGLIEIGQYEKAIEQLSLYIEEMPNSSVGYSERGYAYGALGNDERAVADLNRAIELDPNNETALKSRSILIARSGQTEAAVADMQRAHKEGSDLVAQAGAMLAAERYSDAIVLYSKVLEKTPDDVEALIDRGVAFMEAGLDEAAESDFSNALLHAPDNHHALWRRSLIFSMQDHLEEAEADARRAIELAPTYGHTHFALATVALQQNNFVEAITSLDKAIQLPPGGDASFIHYVVRGSIHRRLGKLDLAIEDLNRALEINPTSTKAITERVFVFALSGDTNAAFDELDRLANLDGGKALSILQAHWKSEGHYSGEIDGIIGPASRRALLACSKDPSCPAPMALLKTEVVLDTSALEPLNSNRNLKEYRGEDPAFSVLYPSNWSFRASTGDVVFVSSDKTALCGLHWYELDWMSQRLPAATIAGTHHDNWMGNSKRNRGYAPVVLERADMSVKGFPTVEYIDDMYGGMSIKRYVVAEEILYKLDCESYTAVFQNKLPTFRRILDSFHPN